MTNKTIAEFNAAGTIAGTDLIAGYQTDSVKYTFNGSLVYYNANVQLASPMQVSNLYGGAPLQISTNTTLTYPFPSVIIANTSGGAIQIHFPNFDSTKCQLGQQILIVNIGSGSAQNVTLYGGTGSQIGSQINGGFVSLTQISAIGTAGVGDNIVQTMSYIENLNLDGIIGVSSNGFYAKTGSNTAAARTLTAGSTLISITNGSGVSGNPTIDVNEANLLINENQVINLVSDLATLNATKQNEANNLSSLAVIPAGNNGIVIKTNGLGTVWSVATITAGSNLIAVTNGDGVAGNPTIDVNQSNIVIAENQVTNLVTDLANLNSSKQNESNNLSSLSVIPAGNNGIVVKTNGLGTVWSVRSLTSSDSSLAISNPDGVSGNPDLILGSTVTPVGKHNLMVSLGSMYPSLTNGVTISQIQSATNLNNYRGWTFPPSVNSFGHLQIAMPKSWNGSTLTIRPYFVTSATSGSVFFTYQAIVRNAGDAFDVSWPTPSTDHPTVSASANALNIGSEVSVPLGGSTSSFPSLVEIRVEREGSNGSDTVTQNILLVYLLFSITTTAGNDA